jgi:hypothetical protein
MNKLTMRELQKKLFEIIKLKNEYIELLEELITKPDIIGKVASIPYINKRLEIQMKLVKLETEVGL